MSCVASRRHLGLLQRFGETKEFTGRDCLQVFCAWPGSRTISVHEIARLFLMCATKSPTMFRTTDNTEHLTRDQNEQNHKHPQIHAMSRRGALQVFQGAQLQFSVSSRTNVLVKDPQRLVVGEQIERRCATSPRLSDLPIALAASRESEWRFVHFWIALVDVDGIAAYQTELTCAWCHTSLDGTTAPTIPVPWIPLPGDMSAGPSRYCEWYQPTSGQASRRLDKPGPALFFWLETSAAFYSLLIRWKGTGRTDSCRIASSARHDWRLAFWSHVLLRAIRNRCKISKVFQRASGSVCGTKSHVLISATLFPQGNIQQTFHHCISFVVSALFFLVCGKQNSAQHAQ